jgi:hypothetical protein
MSSKLEIGYIVKIRPIYDQSIYNGKEGVIVEKRHIGPDWIYTVSVFDNASTTEQNSFYEFELSETEAGKRDRKLKEIGI